MSIPSRQAVRSAWLHRFLSLALLLALLAGLAVPAQAQQAADIAPQDIERLVRTLEDPKAREALVQQLRTLEAAQQQMNAGDVGPASALLEAFTTRVETFGQELMATTTALSDVPRLFDWIVEQMRSEEARRHWLEVLAKLLGVLLVGLGIERAADALLRRPRRAIEARAPENPVERVPLVTGRALLDLVPIAAFAGAALAMLPLLRMGGEPRLAALMLITAYAVARLSMLAAHTALMPRHPGLRLPPIGDETAHYLYIWARRLIGTTIYGYVVAEAALLLGLPASGYEVLLNVLGLLVTTMMVVLILQNRCTVADWIRGRGKAPAGSKMALVRNRFADVWHVLAALYLAMIYGIWALRIDGGFEFMLRATLMTALILAAATLAGTLVRRVINRAFAVSHELRAQFPQLEARANRYLPLLQGVLRGAVTLVTALLLLQTWGIDSFAWLDTGFGRRFVSGGITIAVVVVLALAAWELVSGSIERYLTQVDGDGNPVERSARARTLLPLLRNAILVLLVIIVGLTVLSELGVNIAPLLAGAGVVGLAIGFGSQKLVQDLITGAFILFEDTISVGDVVKLGEHAGLVEAISIRTIRLRDFSGAVHTIPFSSVSTIVNMTKDFSFAVFDVRVSYREDTDQVVEVMREVAAGMQADDDFGKVIVEPLDVVGVDRFGASEVVIRARMKTLPIKQWSVQREFNRRLKRRFDELGIEIPFPHQTIYFGQDKAGNAPPLRMHLDRQLPAADRPAAPAALAEKPAPSRREDEAEKLLAADS